VTAALILAAGVGSRLRPISDRIPKPFLPLGDGTIFGRIVKQIDAAFPGIPIYANLHHQPSAARTILDAEGLADRVITRVEQVLRGPAGSLLTFRDELAREDAVIVLSGDVVFDGDLRAMLTSHHTSRARVTVATADVTDGDRFGVFLKDEHGQPVDLVEKPSWARGVRSTVSAGMYILDGSLLAQVPPDRPWDFGADWLPELLRRESVNLWPIDGGWDDVGSVRTYHETALQHTTLDASFCAATYPDVELLGRNHISAGVRIGAGSVLRDCVLLPGARLPECTNIANAVIG
jgi:NDP-sugar pyrophosphorylase family protein